MFLFYCRLCFGLENFLQYQMLIQPLMVFLFLAVTVPQAQLSPNATQTSLQEAPEADNVLLVAFIAGTSSDDVYIPAASLRMCGVRIMVVGMSSLVLHSQLTDIAYPPSYVLRTDAIEGVQKSSESVSVLISQG